MRLLIIGEGPERDRLRKPEKLGISDAVGFLGILGLRIRFKSSLNENARVHCLTESTLEASHNEIVPFTYNNRLDAKAVLLGWIEDYYQEFIQ